MTEKSLPKLDWRVVFNRAAPPGSRGWGRVRAAQLHEMGKALMIGALGQTFNALLIVYMMHDRAPPMEMALWLGSLALLICYTINHRRRLRGRQLHSLPRKTINRAAYHSIFFGLVWAMPARFFFEHATHGQQLALGVMTATMMAGAAFVFSPIPAAAAAYVLIMGVAATRMLMTTDSAVIMMMGPIYTAAMLMIVVMNGRAFMQRKYLDFVLEERQETVSLLLREYESSDADWLWHTNGQLAFQNVSARFARAVGRSAEELEGMTLLDLLRAVPRTDQSVRRALAAAEGSAARGDHRAGRRPAGRRRGEVHRAVGAADVQPAGPLHRLSGRRIGRHRRAPGGRPDRPHGPPRRAHRPAQPTPAPRQPRGGAARRAGRGP